MSEVVDVKARHQLLHRAFDELLACFIATDRRLAVLETPIVDLMKWSFVQTFAPACEHHIRDGQAWNWIPTPENIAALPDPIRQYLQELEADVVRLRKDKEPAV